jgi:hypothetical protein
MTTRFTERTVHDTAGEDRRALLRLALDLPEEPSPPRTIAAWKAWGLAGWVVVAAGAYILAMLRSL